MLIKINLKFEPSSLFHEAHDAFVFLCVFVLHTIFWGVFLCLHMTVCWDMHDALRGEEALFVKT